jgi:long-chain acyl-CoA synthetase
MSSYNYLTFNDFQKLAFEVGAGLRKLGLGPGDRLHLFASTQ